MTISKEQTDHLFEQFWLAGMRKCNKKKAKPLFNRLLKASDDPQVFTSKLIMDIRSRIANKQFGFDAMHPTTYLNGERWEDEIVLPKIEESQSMTTIEHLTDRSWANDLLDNNDAPLNGHLIEH